MGELLGIPEWLFVTIFVCGGLVIWFAIGWRNTSRQIDALKSHRASPNREDFINLMSPDVRRETAEFLWDTAQPYLEPWQLAAHPEDDLAKDLPIDDDDWGMDWPRDWAELKGFHETNLPDWPEGWPVTVRNFGRWLDMAPV
jgi:hypothetical protein